MTTEKPACGATRRRSGGPFLTMSANGWPVDLPGPGFDYRGETTPYKWPCISSHFGILDTCGFAKDTAWYYKTWWGAEPALHLLPHWNWEGKEGQEIAVWAYCNQDSVELFLNGASLGSQPVKQEWALWSGR